jgi:hypothetical protein
MPGSQVLDVLDAVAEGGGLELGARVAAGLFQFFEDVLHGRQAEAFVGVFAGIERAQERRCRRSRFFPGLDVGEDALHHRVGFRVHRRGIERVVAALDAQEAGGLLEGLLARARHLLERWARSAKAPCGRGARRCSPPGWRSGRRCASAGRRGGIHVHADGIDAVLDDGIERLRQRVATSCWYWPTPMALGSIFTSSASGSCRRRAIDTAPRRLTSSCGNSAPRVPRPNRPRRRLRRR